MGVTLMVRDHTVGSIIFVFLELFLMWLRYYMTKCILHLLT